MVQLVTEPFYSHYFRVDEFSQLMQALEFVIAGTCLGLTTPPQTATEPAVIDVLSIGNFMLLPKITKFLIIMASVLTLQ